ncbi:MAG: uracil-DNA glycosylase [Paludibacteraceae bacterium]|nr:uracil-DNA glycosylase [Paludibacteraceae bacterium]
MDVKIENSWKEALKDEFEKPYFATLCEFVRQEYKSFTIYPPAGLIFNAFNLCPIDKIKVVIIGQDPYHEPGQAHGLCFSVNDGIKYPPSLQNIYKEIASEYNQPMPQSGNLTRWAEQGVLLLNATLTVREHAAGSHQWKGWETFTDNVIKEVNKRCEGVVFLLWGSYAQKKEMFIDKAKVCVLKSAHPSPLSAYRGFFGCNHFVMANEYLRKNGKEEIIW